MALDEIVYECETYPILTNVDEEKNYQQPVNIVEIRQYILWRTNIPIQDVDRNCGYVDNYCG